MELHKALKQIIKTEGPEILSDKRLIYFLTDLQAFNDIQGAKNIIQYLIAENALQTFIRIGEYNDKAKFYVYKIIKESGFRDDSTREIFKAICYALNWSIDETAKTSHNEEKSNKYTNSSEDKTFDYNVNRHSKIHFMGIGLPSKLDVFETKFKSLHFSKLSENDDIKTWRGNFLNLGRCAITLYITPITHLVYTVIVVPDDKKSYNGIITDLLLLYKTKYGNYRLTNYNKTRSSLYIFSSGGNEVQIYDENRIPTKEIPYFGMRIVYIDYYTQKLNDKETEKVNCLKKQAEQKRKQQEREEIERIRKARIDTLSKKFFDDI